MLTLNRILLHLYVTSLLLAWPLYERDNAVLIFTFNAILFITAACAGYVRLRNINRYVLLCFSYLLAFVLCQWLNDRASLNSELNIYEFNNYIKYLPSSILAAKVLPELFLFLSIFISYIVITSYVDVSTENSLRSLLLILTNFIWIFAVIGIIQKEFELGPIYNFIVDYEHGEPWRCFGLAAYSGNAMAVLIIGIVTQVRELQFYNSTNNRVYIFYKFFCILKLIILVIGLHYTGSRLSFLYIVSLIFLIKKFRYYLKNAKFVFSLISVVTITASAMLVHIPNKTRLKLFMTPQSIFCKEVNYNVFANNPNNMDIFMADYLGGNVRSNYLLLRYRDNQMDIIRRRENPYLEISATYRVVLKKGDHISINFDNKVPILKVNESSIELLKKDLKTGINYNDVLLIGDIVLDYDSNSFGNINLIYSKPKSDKSTIYNLTKKAFIYKIWSLAASRKEIWDICVSIIRDNFLFGVGAGNFSNSFYFYRTLNSKLEYFAHNDYLQTFIELGLFGTFPLFLIISNWIYYLFIKLSNKNNKCLLIYLATSILFLALYDFPFQLVNIIILLILTFALLSSNQFVNRTAPN